MRFICGLFFFGLVYIKLSENRSICSKDIKRKQNSGVNQGS